MWLSSACHLQRFFEPPLLMSQTRPSTFWLSFQSAFANAWAFLTSLFLDGRNQNTVFEPKSSVDIARLLVNSRDLRGRGPAEQHARLTIRSLQADLRRMCPSTRGAAQFSNGRLSRPMELRPFMGVKTFKEQRCSLVAERGRTGRLAWQSLAQRLKLSAQGNGSCPGGRGNLRCRR